MLILDEPTVGMDVEARRAFWLSVRAFAARGKTVIFATHYLEEADAYADRAILMAHGRVVADGPTSEIRARVGTRTIRATLPDADATTLASLPGVTAADRRGEAIVLICSDSDAAIRALLEAHPDARDIEIAGAGLEDAFIELTADPDERAPPRRAAGGTGMRSLAYTRFELVRTFRNVRLLVFSLGFPLILYLHHRGAQPQRAQLQRVGDLDPALLHGRARRVRGDVGADLERSADRDRAHRRLDAAAADHAAEDERVLPRQGRDRLRDGRPDDRAAVRVGDLARRQPRAPGAGSR